MTATVPRASEKKLVSMAKLPATITATEPRKRHNENDPVNYMGRVESKPPTNNKLKKALNNV